MVVPIRAKPDFPPGRSRAPCQEFFSTRIWPFAVPEICTQNRDGFAAVTVTDLNQLHRISVIEVPDFICGEHMKMGKGVPCQHIVDGGTAPAVFVNFFACISFSHHAAFFCKRRQMQQLYDVFRRQWSCLRKCFLFYCHIIVSPYRRSHPAPAASGCTWRRRSEAAG